MPGQTCRFCRCVTAFTAAGVYRAWLRRRRAGAVRIEVLVGDPAERRTLERTLRDAVRRLAAVLGEPLPVQAILVQETGRAEWSGGGAGHTTTRTSGARWTLVRLYLTVAGRRLTTGELLACLADEVVAGPALAPTAPARGGQRPCLTLPPDPLAPVPLPPHAAD